jgi:hypothetical protein
LRLHTTAEVLPRALLYKGGGAVVMARRKYPARKGISVVDSDVAPPNPNRRFGKWYWDRINMPDVRLASALFGWKNTDNPYYVWEAIDFCISKKIELPDWVYHYLAECAQRMLSPVSVNAGDLRKVLPQIMGFPQKLGRGHPLEPEGSTWQYLGAAIRFAIEIERGAKPTAALKSAFDALDRKHVDKVDDKTLQRHIKAIFEIRDAPRTNRGWQRAIRAWYVAAFGPFEKEYREISP